MSNHFHILLHAKDDTVGNIVKVVVVCWYKII